MKRLSVIIVSYRTGEALRKCLEALPRAAGGAEFILVDNGNPEAESMLLDEFVASAAEAKLIRGHGNIGFAAACNRGAGIATGEALVFLNPDVAAEAGALNALVKTLLAMGGPGLVGGDLRTPAGAPERGARRDRLTLWRAFVSVTGLTALEPVSPLFRDFNRHRDPIPAAPVRVGAVSGALFAMRRVDFDRIGGFDEGYFLHVEDIDLCRRVEAAGWPVLFVPGPHGVHWRSTSDVAARVVAQHKARSMARYLRKFASGPIESTLAELASGVLHLRART